MNNIPCECGSTDAAWRGTEYGIRVYLCDACWSSPQFVLPTTCPEGQHRIVNGTCEKCAGIVTKGPASLAVAARGRRPLRRLPRNY